MAILDHRKASPFSFVFVRSSLAHSSLAISTAFSHNFSIFSVRLQLFYMPCPQPSRTPFLPSVQFPMPVKQTRNNVTRAQIWQQTTKRQAASYRAELHSKKSARCTVHRLPRIEPHAIHGIFDPLYPLVPCPPQTKIANNPFYELRPTTTWIFPTSL